MKEEITAKINSLPPGDPYALTKEEEAQAASFKLMSSASLAKLLSEGNMSEKMFVRVIELQKKSK